MKRKTTLAAALMLVVILLGVMPQPVAAVTYGDWAQFVSDVTVQDGMTFDPGEAFSKIWRLKNIGTNTWSTDYTLYFVSGSQMSAATPVKLPNSVAPGATVDVSVSMTAPSTAGTYRGYWQLKNASGTAFGIGSTANKSFWVEIKVATSGSTTVGTGYDFAANATSAVWTSGAGALTFPGTDGAATGFGIKLDTPKLENGTTDTAPGLLMAPQNVYGGFIQAQYPAYRVQSGDHFQSVFNCEYNATSCYVTFRLNYQIGTGAIQTFRSFNERYEGLFYRADYDISSLAGQDVKFILYVGAAGYATGDRALWGAPRITSSGTTGTVTPTVTGTPPTTTLTPTATVTPTGTPATPTPSYSTCDRATFIADVNVPDGYIVAPNTAFTKTWRIKNTGSCTWSTDYSLVYISGEKMGGVDAKIKSTVGPNTSFDVSVSLTSPAANGSYRGYWQMKNASGQLFGIGSAANKPWWVDITVKSGTIITPTVTPTPGTSVVGLDFTADPAATSVIWTSGTGTLTFGGTDPSDSGFAQKLTGVKMENGITDSRAALLTVPQNVTEGYIKAVYTTPYVVQTGDHFMATIGCLYGASSCFVTYKVEYQIDSEPVVTLNTYSERFEGLTRNIDINLSTLVGKSVKFVISVTASNGTIGSVDRAVWIAPRIVR